MTYESLNLLQSL